MLVFTGYGGCECDVALLLLLLVAQVREVRGRLLSYWRRQVLVEAAAEAFPPSSSSRGPPHIRATLDNQVGTACPAAWLSLARFLWLLLVHR
jgi:hypothetical protein